MDEQVLISSKVSVDLKKSENIKGRRVSLPLFSSDSGKEVPNYLRASIGSCHDYCKYGKEAVSVRQNRPWIRKTPAATEVVFPTVKSAKIARMNTSNKKPLVKGKCEIMLKAKMSKDSFKSRDEDIKHTEEFPTTSESKLIKEKVLVKKTGATSGATKSEKLKGVVPAKVASPVGGRKSLDAQVVEEVKRNKSNVSMVNRSSAVRKNDTVTRSPIHILPPKKLNAITRPPLAPSPSKLAVKAKTPSSSTPPPVMPIAKSRPLPSPNQLKAKGVVARSPSSSTTKKNKAVTLKASPSVTTHNESVKKNLNFKDQNAKKGDASKTQVTKAVARRCGSIPYTSNNATTLKREGLGLEKSVDVELAEAKEFHEKKEEDSSHAAEFGNKGMDSYDEVPEKTLYVIEMETVNITKPTSCDEDEVPIHSSMTLQPEAGQCELTLQPEASLAPSSTSSCTSSITQDNSTYTETEVDDINHKEDHLIDGENLKGAENAQTPLEDCNKDPMKLTFRRGKVIDISLENNAPRRLKFRKELVVEENIDAKIEVGKSSFKITEATQGNNTTTENSSEAVVLRHQDVQDKKDTNGLFNNVIEETASKLAETRKSKVKALVGAFETVISLQDGKAAATK